MRGAHERTLFNIGSREGLPEKILSEEPRKDPCSSQGEELAVKAKKRRLQGALECGKIQSNMTVCQ